MEEEKKKRPYHRHKKLLHPNKAHPSWGGARVGAGRPKAEDAENWELITIRVPESVKRKYTLLIERGFKPSKVVAESINELADLLGID